MFFNELTNLWTKFHEDWTINMTSRVLTWFYFIHIRKTAPPPWRPFFSTDRNYFQSRSIIRMNVLNKFHEDWTINVTSRVLTKKTAPPPDIIRTIVLTKVLKRETFPPPGGHIFQRTKTILKLNLVIIRTNVLNKFHEDWTINVTPRVLTSKTTPPPVGHVFQRTGSILELSRDIIRTNVLTNFHKDWTKNETSRVSKMFYHSHVLKKYAPPTGRYTNVLTKFYEDSTINVTSRIFELDQNIIGTKLLTKFHEVLTMQNVADERRTKGDQKKLTMSTCSEHDSDKWAAE
ncbi:hypothetical protein DPMN_183554 [Dreissena polymorpha]|uniref:Uncharacterized protein n=1 Tax=Dreissena polymorpha TaxID=45954 RepID=A0A9D4I5M4_DREPO|nr:hypothetical protein DPMN_183554 [Dreissena polymorpha]